MIKIQKDDSEKIEATLEEENKKVLDKTPSKKISIKYKVISISASRIILQDKNGNGKHIPFAGHEKLKVGEEVELSE